MEIYMRICVKDYKLIAENGDTLTLKRGREYTTSAERGDFVTVFSNYWAAVPSDLFAGPLRLGAEEPADEQR